MTTNGEIKRNFRELYRDMAWLNRYLPTDDMMRQVYGFGDSTASAIRSILRKEGFDFVATDGGFLEVTARPPEQEQEEPGTRIAPVAPCADIIARLDRIIALLEKW